MQIVNKTYKALIFSKPYISQQQGALITIVCVNIIGIFHSDKIHTFQIFALFFGLSSFHVMEILLLPEKARAKWISSLFFYTIVAGICGLFIAMHQSQLLFFLKGLVFISLLFLIVQSFPKAKTFFHLVSFALLIWIGLFSLDTNNTKKIINLFIQLVAYFSFTVAFIHWRLGKLSYDILRLLFILEILLCSFLLQWNGIIALGIIVFLKGIMIHLTRIYWQKAPLKILGYEETISLISYLVLMNFF